MRVLVTGGAGFIGSHVVRALLARGDDVTALVRASTPRHRIADLAGRIHLAEASLEDRAGLDALLAEARPEAVIHLGWHAQPADYLHARANLESLSASLRLAERVFASGCPKLVGVGTCLEYAASDRLRRESDPIDPVSLYASCKHAAWLAARALALQRGGELAWARLFHVHGPGEDPARLLPSVAAALRAGRPFELSPGLQVRDHLHVADVASALVRLADPGVRGVFNVCSGSPVTLREVLLAVAEIVGHPELLRFGSRPYALDEVMFLAGDPGRLRETGWTPRMDLRAGLRDALVERVGSSR